MKVIITLIWQIVVHICGVRLYAAFRKCGNFIEKHEV